MGLKAYVLISAANVLYRALTSPANTMANGKDFFVELRKQVTALRQGGNIPGG